MNNNERRNLLVFLLLFEVLGEKLWSWDPAQNHPCNIRRLSLGDEDDADDKLSTFFFPEGRVPPLFPEPLILVPSKASTRNADFRKRTAYDQILDQFPHNFTVTLSSSNALSEHRRETTLRQYIHKTVSMAVTTPDQNSSENWYLFGHTYSEEWQALTRHYELPPCQTCREDLCALSFGIGNRGSGVQWHVHGPGFSEALHGRKHWLLYPPEQKPEKFHKDQSSRQWMEFVYPQVDPKPFECTLNPGDLIYFPDEWWHATINLDPYTASISTFTTEHHLDRFRDEL
ncbi:hypothetical protein ACA910_005986 [Epithemia clementina (nom. ined.)]